MTYSGYMTDTTLTAPDITPGYPSKGTRVGPAWTEMWTRLKGANDWVDGTELAADVAEDPGNGRGTMSPETLLHLLRRAATAGHLEKQTRTVDGGRGPRRRSFYRIAR